MRANLAPIDFYDMFTDYTLELLLNNRNILIDDHIIYPLQLGKYAGDKIIGKNLKETSAIYSYYKYDEDRFIILSFPSNRINTRIKLTP